MLWRIVECFIRGNNQFATKRNDSYPYFISYLYSVPLDFAMAIESFLVWMILQPTRLVLEEVRVATYRLRHNQGEPFPTVGEFEPRL